MKKVISGALALVGLSALISAFFFYAAPTSGYGAGTLSATKGVLTGKISDDSAMPMGRAWQYWERGNQRGNQEHHIYSDLLIGEGLKFQYPPTSLFVPWLLQEGQIESKKFYSWTMYFFLAINIASVAGIVFILANRYGRSKMALRSFLAILLAVVPVALTYYPLVRAVTLGQIQVWINALFALSMFCVVRSNLGAAGVLIGIISLLKPQYGLIALWGVLRGSKQFSSSFLATALVGHGLGMVMFGWGTYLDYVDGLSFLSRHGEAFFPNQSVNGLVNRIFSVTQPELYNNIKWEERYFPPYNPWVYYATLASSMSVLCVCLWRWRHNSQIARAVDFGLISLGVTVASPIAWEHHYGILLSLFAIVVPVLWFDRAFADKRGMRLVAVVCFLFSTNYLPWVNVVAATYANFLQSYLLFSAVGMLILLHRIRSTALNDTNLEVKMTQGG